MCNAAFACQCVHALGQRAESVFKVSGLIPGTLLPLMVFSPHPPPQLSHCFQKGGVFPPAPFKCFRPGRRVSLSPIIECTAETPQDQTVDCTDCSYRSFLVYRTFALHSKPLDIFDSSPVVTILCNWYRLFLIKFYD